MPELVADPHASAGWSSPRVRLLSGVLMRALARQDGIDLDQLTAETLAGYHGLSGGVDLIAEVGADVPRSWPDRIALRAQRRLVSLRLLSDERRRMESPYASMAAPWRWFVALADWIVVAIWYRRSRWKYLSRVRRMLADLDRSRRLAHRNHASIAAAADQRILPTVRLFDRRCDDIWRLLAIYQERHRDLQELAVHADVASHENGLSLLYEATLVELEDLV